MKLNIVFTLYIFFGQVVICQAKSKNTNIRVMTFNILEGGGSTSILGNKIEYKGPRYNKLAAAIKKANADIVGVQELTYKTDGGDRLLKALGEGWYRAGSIYSKYKLTAINKDCFFSVSRVHLSEKYSVIVIDSHWWPKKWGPGLVRKHLLEGTVSKNLTKFNKDIATACDSANGARGYLRTVKKAKEYIDAGETVFVLGDFNEPSHLDWTSKYAEKGKDLLVKNPTKTPLRFEIEWKGSKALFDIGLKDAYRNIFPDEVKNLGTTWTPPYEDGILGRCKYDDQVLIRIDIIYFAGKNIKVIKAAVVGESKKTAEIVYTPWPSDHRAVVAEFEFGK